MAFVYANNHTVVFVANATFLKGFANEWVARMNHELVQVHFALLNVGVAGNEIIVHCGVEGCELFVASDGLNLVEREKARSSVGNVDALFAA